MKYEPGSYLDKLAIKNLEKKNERAQIGSGLRTMFKKQTVVDEKVLTPASLRERSIINLKIKAEQARSAA